MSAFVGLLNLDGRPCRDEIVGAMLERLRHRVDEAGWNARRVRVFGPLGLGSAPLGSTPQARFERESPDNAQTRTQNGQTLCIAGHVRLDNRDDLARELALGATEARQWSDGRFVLEAYAKWSEETPRHLRGDFAFAIWDSARRRLFCARDRFGARPFYFAFRPGQLFACANEIKALWAVPGLAPVVNRVQAVAFLLARADDKERTFYEGVHRLPPASHLVLDLNAPDNPRHSRYWAPDAARASNFQSDDETSEALRETFFASVKERTRAEGEFSLFLSGGLDSSSIAAAAPRVAPQNKPVRALSMVFERFPECDEREWIEQNLAFSPGALEKLWIAGDDTSALHDIERILWHLDGPSVGPNIASTWTQYPPLQNAGSRVVLDGHGGDEVVFLGYGRVGELMRRGDYASAWRELCLLRRHDLLDASFGPLFWSALLRRARGTRGLGRLMALSTRAGKGDGTRRNSAFQNDQDEMNAPILRLLCPEARELIEPEPWVAPPRDLRQEHARTLDSGLQSAAMEVMDSMAGAHAVEVRCPFWEQNMVELCLSLPAEQKMRDGFNRFVMRRAMEGLLPPQVQWRTGKTNFSPQLIYGLRELERHKIDRTLQRWQSAASAVEGFIEPQLLGELWASVQSETQSDASPEAATKALALWRVLSLGLWLDGATRASPAFQEEL